MQLIDIAYAWLLQELRQNLMTAGTCMQLQDPAVLFPVDIWLHVFHFLQCRDRVRLRQVCRTFSTYHPTEDLRVVTGLHDEASVCSLVRFLMRQARQTKACLRLHLTAFERCSWHIPCLLAGAACSNLHDLGVTFALSLAEANLLLALVLAGLLCLDLTTNASILSCASLARLKQLSHLSLSLQGQENGPVFPSGLAKLNSLVDLTVIWSCKASHALDATNLRLPALQYFGISDDPFLKGFKLSHFPQLRVLELLYKETQVPAWLSGHALLCLKCATPHQLRQIDPRDLHIRELWIHNIWACCIALQELNALPVLQKLVLCGQQHRPSATRAGRLIGQQWEYITLLEGKQLILDVPVDLELVNAKTMKPRQAADRVRLGRHGHPLGCHCGKCQTGSARMNENLGQSS